MNKAKDKEASTQDSIWGKNRNIGISKYHSNITLEVNGYRLSVWIKKEDSTSAIYRNFTPHNQKHKLKRGRMGKRFIRHAEIKSKQE
jgi:hypothetical protein